MGYRIAIGFVRALVRFFFRRIDVEGIENVPSGRGGVLVSWHPNGLVDPALILTHFPERVVFGARHGLFKWPLLGALMRVTGTVPIYRAQDASAGSEGSRKAGNQQSLDALAAAVATGSFSALFPEGVSHDAPHLQTLKTGAARLYYRAHELKDAGEAPVLIPVGLHYDDKSVFRSSALVAYHPPIELDGPLSPGPLDEEADRERARALTDLIEARLQQAVHPTESWELNHLMHRTRKLMRAERGKRAGARLPAPGMAERRLGFERVWAGYNKQRETDPTATANLLARVAEYDADLRALGMADHELDRGPRLLSMWIPVILIGQMVLVYFLLPPLLLAGYVFNGPTYLLIKWAAHARAKQAKDLASIKLLAGALLYPITWLTAGVLVARGTLNYQHAFEAMPGAPLAAGLSTGLLAIVGGLVALRYLELARETWRSVKVRLTRRVRWEAVARLSAERSALHDAIAQMAEGLALPGEVAADGRVQVPSAASGEPS